MFKRNDGLRFLSILFASSLLIAGAGVAFGDEFDQFDSPKLSDDWRWDDPNGDDEYNLTEREGWLMIHCQAGDVNDMWMQRLGAPLLLRDVPRGNYSFETRMQVEEWDAACLGGLVVYDPNVGNFSLYERRIQENVKVCIPGNCMPDVIPAEGETDTYLRVVKEGNTFESYVKFEEEEDWQFICETDLTGLPEEHEIGLLLKAWAGNTKGLTVYFDYFRYLELGGQTVAPAGKLPTIWGMIKSSEAAKGKERL